MSFSKKKLIPILLVVLLVVGLMPVNAFAEEPPSDRVVFETAKKDIGISEKGIFELTDACAGIDGWRGGTNDKWLKIRTLNGETITRIEARVGSWGKDYGNVGVSRGLKQPDGAVYDGTTVSVTNINSSEFSFSGGSDWVYFTEIKVFYTGGTGSTLSQGNIWIASGVAVLAVAAVTVLVVVKKKKPAVANNTEKEDKE